MPRLLPKAPNFLANMMIPDEVKTQAVAVFCDFTKGIDVKTFSDLVEMDVSLWEKLLTDEIRRAIVENAKDYKTWIKLANESLILDWIFEARVELKPVLNTKQGRLWFYKQWAEIMKAIGA